MDCWIQITPKLEKVIFRICEIQAAVGYTGGLDTSGTGTARPPIQSPARSRTKVRKRNKPGALTSTFLANTEVTRCHLAKSRDAESNHSLRCGGLRRRRYAIGMIPRRNCLQFLSLEQQNKTLRFLIVKLEIGYWRPALFLLIRVSRAFEEKSNFSGCKKKKKQTSLVCSPP